MKKNKVVIKGWENFEGLVRALSTKLHRAEREHTVYEGDEQIKITIERVKLKKKP